MIIILIIIIIIIILYNCNSCENFTDTNVKPYLWQYWDNIDDNETPGYIKLCMETVDINCKNSFNIVRLNKDNIKDYLPEIVDYNLDNLIIAHKVDLYRIMLLYKYGGLYMDADIVVLRDPIEIMAKLNTWDFIGFGCTPYICKDGYSKPSNWMLGSRPNTTLMKNILDNIKNKLANNIQNYHAIGKYVIWEELDKLIENNYSYYQYPSTIDGTRDINGHWVDSSRAFSDEKIIYDDEDNMMFFIIYNTGIPDYIKQMTISELLSKNYNFTRFIKKTL